MKMKMVAMVEGITATLTQTTIQALTKTINRFLCFSSLSLSLEMSVFILCRRINRRAVLRASGAMTYCPLRVMMTMKIKTLVMMQREKSPRKWMTAKRKMEMSDPMELVNQWMMTLNL